jgi:hypothetical protein
VQHNDAKIVDKACVCFERLVESFQARSERLAILASAGLIPNMLAVMKGTVAEQQFCWQ